jgi:hypothetical protein
MGNIYVLKAKLSLVASSRVRYACLAAGARFPDSNNHSSLSNV